MIHNFAVECFLNAQEFYKAYRALCKMRIAYAKHVIALELADLDAYWTEGKANQFEKSEKFWTKVQDYWKGKLAHSYELEKEYMGK